MSGMNEDLPAGRYFLALWPDQGCRQSIAAVAGRWLKGVQCRRIRIRSLHLTLRFLGNLDAMHTQRLQACMPGLMDLGVSPFTCALERYGHFGRRVAWLGSNAGTRGCLQLRDALDHILASTGLDLSCQQTFVPHVSVARDAHADWPQVPGESVHIPWFVNELALVLSRQGRDSEYRVVARFPLRGRT